MQAGRVQPWHDADGIRTEHEGMFTEMGIKIKALIARKLPGDAAVTWIEPKVLKKRKAAEEAAAAAKEE